MWRESFEFGVGVRDPHPLQEQADYLFAEVVPNNSIRVARFENQVVGFVAASSTSIAQLYVRRGFQRRGIGSRLLAWAKAQSAGTLWLHTFARNRGACAFYEHHGFKVVARGYEPTWQLDDLRYEWSAHPMIEWVPISEDQLIDRISQGCAAMSEASRRLWDAVRIKPEKWQQHPYGDEGGGFWVVALVGRTVIWYNDIEDGFNRSVYSKYGTIDDYWCNQDELNITIQYLANALEGGKDLALMRSPPKKIP